MGVPIDNVIDAVAKDIHHWPDYYAFVLVNIVLVYAGKGGSI